MNTMKPNDDICHILTHYFDVYSDIPVLLLDNEQHIISCNKAFRKKRELSKTPVGASVHEILTLTIDFSDPLESDNESGVHSDIIQCSYTAKGVKRSMKGHILWNKAISVILFDIYEVNDIDIIEKISRNNMEMSAMNRNFSKQNRALSKRSREMEETAKIDPLTKVWNRRYLSELLSSLLIEINEEGKIHNFGILMYDLDNFKYFNDTYGHDAGDAILTAFSKEIKSAVRQGDIISRYGGEEFVAVLFDVDYDSLLHIGEKIRVLFASLSFEGIQEPVTASFGATLCKSRDTQDSLLKRADDALYKAKQSGKNTIVFK